MVDLSRQTVKMDLVTFDVLRKAFVNLVDEASFTIERVAYHPIVSSARDRSSSLLTRDGRLVCHGNTDAAPHYGTFETGIKTFLQQVPLQDLRPGDVYLYNDPHKAGTHLNDVRLIRAIFHQDQVVGFACNLAHWPDIGGPLPGSFNPMATETYAEGLRFPPMKIYENNKVVTPLLNFIRLNVRGAEERIGDITGKFEAGKLIERRYLELIDKYGLETVEEAIEESFDYTERVLRRGIEDLPDGTYYFEDWGDEDTMGPGRQPIGVRCNMTIKGDQISFDWSGSDPQPRGSWGFTRPSLLSANYLGFMVCFPHLFPLNHGVTRSIENISVLGTCVDVREPAAVSGYCSGAFDKVMAATIGCLAQPLAKMGSDRVYPGSLNLTNCCIGGMHPAKHRPYVHYWFCLGGGMARTFKDGQDYFMMAFAARCMHPPHELEERWFPILYTGFEAMPDTHGHGKYRGGTGVMRTAKMLGDATLTIHGDREKFPPNGLGGGTNGGPAGLSINKGTPEARDLGMYATGVSLNKGDIIYYKAVGGGAYGNPLERDPQMIVEDIMDGYTTLKAAREIYGVSIKVIDEETLDYQIDLDETKKLREELVKKPLARGLGPYQVHPLGEKIKLAEKR